MEGIRYLAPPQCTIPRMKCAGDRAIHPFFVWCRSDCKTGIATEKIQATKNLSEPGESQAPREILGRF